MAQRFLERGDALGELADREPDAVAGVRIRRDGAEDLLEVSLESSEVLELCVEVERVASHVAPSVQPSCPKKPVH